MRGADGSGEVEDEGGHGCEGEWLSARARVRVGVRVVVRVGVGVRVRVVVRVKGDGEGDGEDDSSTDHSTDVEALDGPALVILVPAMNMIIGTTVLSTNRNEPGTNPLYQLYSLLRRVWS